MCGGNILNNIFYERVSKMIRVRSCCPLATRMSTATPILVRLQRALIFVTLLFNIILFIHFLFTIKTLKAKLLKCVKHNYENNKNVSAFNDKLSIINIYTFFKNMNDTILN